MNDFDYDVMQKKKTASGAKHRVNGSKSRKCTLRTDYMTPSQIKKQNGAVISYNINKPMDWKTFKSLPDEAFSDYMTQLGKRFRLNYSVLGKMLGVSSESVRVYMKGKSGSFPFESHKRLTDAEKAAWDSFLRGESSEENDEKIVETVEEVKTEEERPEKVMSPEDTGKKSGMRMDGFHISLSGTIDIVEIANSLRLFLGDNNRTGTIDISFRPEACQ